MYYRGIVLPSDLKNAKTLFQLSADQGFEPAKRLLREIDETEERDPR